MNPVAICNMALSFIGANVINKLDFDSPSSVEEQLCAVNFYPTVQTVLEAKAWLFATGYVNLGAITAAPAGQVDRPDFPDRRAIPADTIAIRALDDGSGSFTIKGERNGEYVVTEPTASLYAVVTRYERDSNKWTPTFAKAVAYCLAADICLPLNNNVKLMEIMLQKYAAELKKAGTFDGLQGTTNRQLQVITRSSALRR